MSRTSTRYMDLLSLWFINFETCIITSSCHISWSVTSFFPRLIRVIFPLIVLCSYNKCARLRSAMERSSRHYRTMENQLSRSITLEGCKSLLYTCEIQKNWSSRDEVVLMTLRQVSMNKLVLWMIVWHIFWDFENLFNTFGSSGAESSECSIRKNVSAWQASTQEDAVGRVEN